MTAYTSTQSGLASANSTWGGGGHPSANGDTIAAGSSAHVIDWDLDLSGLTTGLGASVFIGTIRAYRSAGSYILKMNGNLSGTGLMDASDGSGGAYAGTQTFELRFNGNFINSMSGIQNLICVEPTHKFVKLTADAIAGATVLSIDTDLTGETLYWVNTNLVRIDDINQAIESEQYTISSKTSSTLTLTSGLTNAKSAGAYIILVTRNVKVTGVGGATSTGFNAPATASIISAEIRGFATGIISGAFGTIGGSITGCTTGFSSWRAATINAVFSGCTTAVTTCDNGTLTAAALISAANTGVTTSSSMIISCPFTGCVTAITLTDGQLVDTTISGCATGIAQKGNGLIPRNVVFSNNTRDLLRLGSMQMFNCALNSATQFLDSTLSYRSINACVESFDDGQVVDAYKNWCKGGTVVSITSGTIYPGRVRSYQHIPVAASQYVFRDQIIEVPAGGWINVNCFIQKDASMTYLPRVQIFPMNVEPLISGSLSAETIMPDSINTWEILFAKFQNTGTAPKLFKVRVIASNGSGNVFEDCDISVSPFGNTLGEVA